MISYIFVVYFVWAIRGDLISATEANLTTIQIVKGKNLSIFCDLTGTAGEGSNVEWIKDGEKHNILKPSDKYSISDNNTLHIIKAEPGDAGTYECQTTSSPPYSKKFLVYYFHLDKMSPKMIVKELTEVNLTCSADGRPLPTVQWFKDDQQLNDSDTRYSYTANEYKIQKGVLIIPNATKVYEGNYTCKIFGDLATYTTSTDFKIMGKDDPSAGGGCGTGCIVGIIVPVVLIVAIALAIFLKKKSLLLTFDLK